MCKVLYQNIWEIKLPIQSFQKCPYSSKSCQTQTTRLQSLREHASDLKGLGKYLIFSGLGHDTII